MYIYQLFKMSLPLCKGGYCRLTYLGVLFFLMLMALMCHIISFSGVIFCIKWKTKHAIRQVVSITIYTLNNDYINVRIRSVK